MEAHGVSSRDILQSPGYHTLAQRETDHLFQNTLEEHMARCTSQMGALPLLVENSMDVTNRSRNIGTRHSVPTSDLLGNEGNIAQW